MRKNYKLSLPTIRIFQSFPIGTLKNRKELSFCNSSELFSVDVYSNMRIYNGGIRVQNLITLYCSVSKNGSNIPHITHVEPTAHSIYTTLQHRKGSFNKILLPILSYLFLLCDLAERELFRCLGSKKKSIVRSLAALWMSIDHRTICYRADLKSGISLNCCASNVVLNAFV